MIFHRADPTSLIIFSVFAIAMAAIVSYAMKLANVSRKWRITFAILILIFTGASLSGILQTQFFPLGPLLLISALVFALAFSFSSPGAKMASTFSYAALIGFQSFRLPLEIILHHWSGLGTVPPTMTWTGQNWDIVTGVVSLLVFRWVNGNRKLAFLTNTIGAILLLNVLRVVVMSSPLPFAWSLDEPLVLIAYFPYALIGPLFVLPALVAHIVTFRKLLK